MQVSNGAQRWHTGVPFGPPHISTQDDTVTAETARGEERHNIPKKSTLQQNIWWFVCDPSWCKDPDTFEPARFLRPELETDPATLILGSGRRFCPGRVLEDANVRLMMAQTLAVFEI